MELSEKKLQKSLVDFLEIENIELIPKFLNKNVCNFKEIVDKYKNIKDHDNRPCLYILLRNKELFQELIESNKLNEDNLKYLLNRIDEQAELRCLSYNIVLLKYIIDKNILSFKELVDKFKGIQDERSNPCLYRLLKNKEVLNKLIRNKLYTTAIRNSYF